MGTSPLGLKLCRRIARDVGEPIKRAVGSGGYDFGFVTFDHRHGGWSKRDGTVEWYPDDTPMLHWWSCSWNFGADPVPPDLCGERDVSLLAGGDLICDLMRGHDGRHRCGSEAWS